MTTAGQIYQNIAALKPVKRILEEADKALDDRGTTIATSDIPEVLGGIAGGAIGVGVGLTLVYTSGVAGVSAAGITSGLATLGAIIGGGMMAGIFVAAAPMAALGVGGICRRSEAEQEPTLSEGSTVSRGAAKTRRHPA